MSSVISQNLRAERARQGLKQTELAKLAGVGAVTISLIECGKQTPSVRTLEAIARALKVKPSVLLEDRMYAAA